MTRMRFAHAPLALAIFAAAAVTSAATVFTGCKSKMDPQECIKVKEGAFELLNQANVCSSDADCKPSTWPGCAKPISAANGEKIKASLESFQKGSCEEAKLNCQPPPAVYCQEGICAFRYKPADPASGGGLRIE